QGLRLPCDLERLDLTQARKPVRSALESVFDSNSGRPRIGRTFRRREAGSLVRVGREHGEIPMKHWTAFAAAGVVALALHAPASAADISGASATFPYPIYAKWADAYKKQTGN